MYRNILVDGNNILHRSVGKTEKFLEDSGNPRKLNADGLDVSALQKFIFDLYFLTQEFHTSDSRIYIVWDRKLKPNVENWRKTLNPTYKANRDSLEDSPQKKSVHDICFHLKNILKKMGISSVFPLVSEGDDLINYLQKNLEGGSVIISADQDFYQCVSETCAVSNAHKKFTLTLDNFEEHVPVSLENYVLYKSIKGDSSDNIGGLYRYGEVKGKKLVDNWERDSKNLSPEQIEQIEDAKKLVDLDYRPLSKEEKYIVDEQVKKYPERANDWELTQIYDTYNISLDARSKWDKYFATQDLGFL